MNALNSKGEFQEEDKTKLFALDKQVRNNAQGREMMLH